MALSNWDTLALDLDGNPTVGSFTSPLEVTVEIYKNWLYVSDPKAWRPEGSFTKPVVAQLTEGTLRYQDLNIAAKRGPQQGVYAVIWTPGYKYQPKGEKLNFELPARGIVACGVYGYEDDDQDESGARFVGVKPESARWFQDQLHGKHAEAFVFRMNQMEDNKWTHSDHATEIEIFDWDGFDLSFPEQVRSLDFSQAIRYNQGDAFFADTVITTLPATTPGYAQPTTLSKILGKMKNSQEIDNNDR